MDTWLCDFQDLFFILNRGAVAKRRVSPLPVVPDLDELKELAAGLGSRRELGVDQQFFREGGEEAFHDGVVPAIPRPTHAGREASLLQELLVRAARILDAAIGMMQSAGARAALSQRHAQRAQREFLIQPCTQA